MRLLVGILVILMGVTIGWEISKKYDEENDDDEY